MREQRKASSWFDMGLPGFGCTSLRSSERGSSVSAPLWDAIANSSSPSMYQISARLNVRLGIALCAKHLASSLMYPVTLIIYGHTARRRTFSRATINLTAPSSFERTNNADEVADNAMIDLTGVKGESRAVLMVHSTSPVKSSHCAPSAGNKRSSGVGLVLLDSLPYVSPQEQSISSSERRRRVIVGSRAHHLRWLKANLFDPE